MITIRLPDSHVWLRLTRPEYQDPLDTGYAARQGGRWNPPDSWPTLYLNEDMATVHAQLRHMFVGRAVDPDDIADHAPVVLVAATLPGRQAVADVVNAAGVAAAGLPATYPYDDGGELVARPVTQQIGRDVHAAGVRGVWCRSAAGTGRELAWFPAARSAARAVWRAPLPYGAWRHARTLAGLV